MTTFPLLHTPHHTCSDKRGSFSSASDSEPSKNTFYPLPLHRRLVPLPVLSLCLGIVASFLEAFTALKTHGFRIRSENSMKKTNKKMI